MMKVVADGFNADGADVIHHRSPHLPSRPGKDRKRHSFGHPELKREQPDKNKNRETISSHLVLSGTQWRTDGKSKIGLAGSVALPGACQREPTKRRTQRKTATGAASVRKKDNDERTRITDWEY
jgi:hypothetical protein